MPRHGSRDKCSLPCPSSSSRPASSSEADKLAHRDIKPANIVVLDNFSRLVLLDFGVLKPVGEVGLTDVDEQRLFVGTLQYSSPEFLLRDEEDNEQGWRALSIYQGRRGSPRPDHAPARLR